MSERDIFLAALDRECPTDRTTYLDEACSGDPALRRQVEALLESHEGAGSFLGTPAAEQAATNDDQADAPTIFVPPSKPEFQKPPGEQFDGGSNGDATHPDSVRTAGDEPLAFLAPSDQPGRLGRLGHYQIMSIIGQGGMGVVLKAFDESLHRVVAIKVMAPQLATTASARQRFIREARAAAAVAHEHVVTIHAVDETSPLPHIVMQCVEGTSLEEKLNRVGPLGVKEILRIGTQAAAGLAAAHKQGLIHRDIKPANILLENGVERVKITDFGLARAADDASMTQSGLIAGTPQYMSPEQAEGRPVDQRSDLFSLGSVLYALCTGRPAFRANSTVAVLKRVCEEAPRPIREINPEIPEWLCDIISKLHAKDPADRFQSAKEVAELLERHLSHVQQPSLAPLPPRVQLSPAKPQSLATLEKLFEATDVRRRLIQHASGLSALAIFMLSLALLSSGEIMPIVGMLLLGIALVLFAVCFLVRQRFDVEYLGHHIRFENGMSTGEKLLIDGKCAARGGFGYRIEMRAPIAAGKGAGDEVVVISEAGIFHLRCRILVERTTGVSKPDPRATNAQKAFSPLALVPVFVVTAITIPILMVFNSYWIRSKVAPTPNIATVSDKPVVLTKGAVQEVMRRRDVNQITGRWYLRVRVEDLGNGTGRHLIDIDSTPLAGDDFTYEFEGLQIVVARSQIARLRGATVDYRSGPDAAGFFVTNPNLPDSTSEDLQIDMSTPPPAVAPFDAAQAKEHQKAWAKHLGIEPEITNSIGMRLSLIPPGEFVMGSTKQEVERMRLEAKSEDLPPSFSVTLAWEQPPRRVVLTKARYMGLHEVTIAQFRRFVEAAKYETEAEKSELGGGVWDYKAAKIVHGKEWNWRKPEKWVMQDEQPVTQITWNDAKAFCSWLSEQEGRTYRLPTEAEWEFACRAGSTTRFPFGESGVELARHATFHQPGGPPTTVGSKAPNAFGLHDTLGNAYEWCQDWLGSGYDPRPAENPPGIAEGSQRIVRGGSYDEYMLSTRPAQRRGYAPDFCDSATGFRVVIVGDLKLKK